MSRRTRNYAILVIVCLIIGAGFGYWHKYGNPFNQPIFPVASVPLNSDEPGHAFVFPPYRKTHSRQEVAEILRKDDPKVLRVRSKVIIDKIAEVTNRGSWESTDEFIGWFRSSAVTEIACTPRVLKNTSLWRTDETGKRFDPNWHRANGKCDRGEKFYAYEGKIFLSSTCLNVASGNYTPHPPQPLAPVKAEAPAACSQKLIIVIRDGDDLALRAPGLLREVRHRVDEASVVGKQAVSYRVDDRVSRGMGAALAQYSSPTKVSIPIPLVFFHRQNEQIVDDGLAEVVNLHDGYAEIPADNLVGKNVKAVFPGNLVLSPYDEDIVVFADEWKGCLHRITAVSRPHDRSQASNN